MMICPILTTDKRSIYCTPNCMAYMSNNGVYGCKLINKNSAKESWHVNVSVRQLPDSLS